MACLWFKSGLINQAGIESLFRRDVKINHTSQKGAYRGSNKWEKWGGSMGSVGAGKKKKIKHLTPCFQPSARKDCRCARRWIGKGWCWRTWSSTSRDPHGTSSVAGIDLKDKDTGISGSSVVCAWLRMKLRVNKLVEENQSCSTVRHVPVGRRN